MSDDTVKFQHLIDEERELHLDGEARFAFFRSRLSDLAEQAAFWRFYKQYLSVMAAPHQLIPKICETDYRLLESGRKLGEYVRRFSTLAFAGSIPLGRAQQTQLDLIPRPEMIELWDNLPRWREMSNSDGQGQVAPAAYFCITKCRVEDGSRRWNPGVPIDDEEAGIVSGPVRKVSGESDTSHQSVDSGYLSGRSRADSMLGPSTSATVRGRKESMAGGGNRQVRDDDDNYDADSCQATLEQTFSQPLYYLGELAPTSLRLDHYVVAVSLYDLSLWLIYNAWNRYPDVTQDDLDDIADPNDDDASMDQKAEELECQKWFRPDQDPAWAHFPGLAGRTLMAKLANNVQTWPFSEAAEVCMIPVWKAEDVVPAFVCARLTSDGYAVRPKVDRTYANSS